MELFKVLGKFAIEGADQAGKDIDNITKKGDLSKTTIGKASAAVGSAVKTAAAAGGVALGAFAATSIKTGTDFQAAMSEVAAISGASEDELDLLTETAKAFGSSTQFSASEAAEALKYMSLAGWDAETSASALGGVLNLAAASGMDLASASDLVTDYMSAFGWEASRSAEFADILAFAQANSNTTTEALGEAFKNCAANMNAAGQDVETVTSCLEAMANQGLKGSEAGTALTAIMRDITSNMEEGAIAIGGTSVAVMDENGNFRDLTDILTDVSDATNGMGDAERAMAMGAVFTADSQKGLNLLLNEGVDNVAGYEEALRNSSGTAEDMAGTMNDNVAGSVKSLQSAFEGAQIAFFDCFSDDIQAAIDAVAGVVRNVADAMPALDEKLQGVKDKLSGIDWAGVADSLERWAPLIAGIVAGFIAFNTALGIYNTIQTISQAIQAAKIAMNLSETATLGALAAAEWAAYAPMLLIAAAIAAIIAIGVLLYQNWDTIKEKATEVWGAITDWFGTTIETLQGFFSGLWEHIQTIWDTICNVIQTAVMLIGSILSAAFQIITLPYRFIWENCKEYVFAAWNWIKEKISTAINAIKTVITNIMNAIKTVWTNVWNAIKSFLDPIINGIKTVISTVFNGIKTVISNVWDGIKTKTTSVWNGIKTAVSTVVNGVKTVVSNVFDSVKTKVTTVWNGIKTAITTPINAARDTVKGVVDKITGFFSGMNISLPKIKLPHFSVTGELSIAPPSVPHLSIDWYKKAMDEPYMFTEPTLFSYNPLTGSAKGAGEMGDEVMIGKNTMLGMIQQAVAAENGAMTQKLQRIIDLLTQFFPDALGAMNQQLVLDTGVLVGATASAMDAELGKIAIRKGRGR